jgi:hypothetical protein
MADLTQGRDPLDRLTPQADPDSRHERGADDAGRPGPRADGPDEPAHKSNPVPMPALINPVPMPALINLIVPAGTLLGWSSAPAEAGTWGLLDRDETRTIVNAAAQHPRTRWCVTLTAPDRTAVAHACARGRYPLLLSDLAPQPPPAQLAELLRRLNLTFTPVASGTCDHAEAEEHYTPSRKLKHLIRARTATCDAPGCQAQALNTDLDHTIPWPDGPTEQCNLAPRCRTHHRAKQAPDWRVEQSAPGVTRWTLPSGRTDQIRHLDVAPGPARQRPAPGTGSCSGGELVRILDDRDGAADGLRHGEALGRALVGVLDDLRGGAVGRCGGAGSRRVAGEELVADGLQVRDLPGGRAGGAGDRDGDAGEHVVGARRRQREDVADAGCGRVAGGQRLQVPALLDRLQ